MDDLSFEINAPKNLKSKQTGSRKKFPELSSKSNPCNKENKKPTKSIKLWDPNEDIKKFLNKKPTKASVPQSKLKTVEKSKKENVGRETKVKPTSSTVSNLNKLKSTLPKPVSTNPLKSTYSTGYVSSNESYKSTTYEFSGNSRDGSANLSDDSLVKIFKSKLPTSVKINKILTPRVNNVKIKSSTQSSVLKEKIDQSSNSQKSKKLDFPEEKLTEPAITKEKNNKGSYSRDPKNLDFIKGKSSKLLVPEKVRYSINFRNSTDFNAFATPLKTTNSKISTPTELETTPNSKIPLQIKCIKSPLAQNENTKRRKVQGANFVVHKSDLSKKNVKEFTTKRTQQQKHLVSTQDALEKPKSSILLNKSSESRDSSLHSSLSPSPSKNCRSSLFSTISMESKESHDSSGSVYISATESLSPSSELNQNDKKSKKPKRSSKEKDTSMKTKEPNYSSVEEKVTNGSSKTKNQKIEEEACNQKNFNCRQLRSRTNDSLFTTISSNESISVVNSCNVKHFTNSNIDSRPQNDKSSLLISGIEKLNLTENGKENQNSNLMNKSPVQSQSLKATNCRTSILSEVSNHSSLFSSINSSASRTEQKKATGEVITISSDSSFDIDASLSDLNIKETVKESILCNDTDNSNSTKPNSKIDTHASLYSTLGNANLTSGVKITKSKYFFNSSDKSISSIGSEPSCIESSIMPSKGNLFKKMAATPELNELEEYNEDFSKDNLPKPNLMNHTDNTINCSIEKKLPTPFYKMDFDSKKEKKIKSPSKSKIQNESKKSNEKSCNIDAIFDKTKVFDGEKWVEKVVGDCDNIQLAAQNEKDSKPKSKSDSPNVPRKTDQKSDTMDALFDKTKVFDGKAWVDNVNTDRDETSFKFKEPKNQLERNGVQNEVDLSTWSKNSRGNVKIKVDRYSLNFNFNKLMGKTETTSTETLDNFSSDVKHCADLAKRKSINRDLRKSIEAKRSIAMSSDSEDDSDDEIRVVSKARRKQRILESSDENSGSSAKAISSDDSEFEDIRPKSKDKKSKKCPLADLTNEFDDLLTIQKKPTGKAIPSTPKTGPTVQDKKSKAKAKQLTAVPNTPFRNDKASKTNKLTFLDSLSDHIPDACIPHPEAALYKSKFKTKKEELARRLFHLYNKEIFGLRLPPDMPLEWNGRMRTTSGFCYNKRMRSGDPAVPEVRSARIALSKKILDRPDRLRDTLVHELCHAASWLVDGVRDGHGPNWRKWTIYAMQRFPELPPIKRCHEYKIDHKYVYRCSQCDYEFGRHSKSLNLERQVCGYCHGKFVLLTNTRQGQTETDKTNKRPPTQFAMFVKENYAKVKQENAGIKHGDVMRLLSKKFAESKAKDS